MAKELTKKQTAKIETDPNREQEIRRRAYALYEERGHEDGHDVDDWLALRRTSTPPRRKPRLNGNSSHWPREHRGRSFIC